MSFPPVSTEYGNDCLTCYPAGLTPKFLYASFGQIKMGALWYPALGLPPNGLVQLTQTVANPCIWEIIFGPAHYVRYTTTPGVSILTIVVAIARIAFISNVAFDCIRFHFNSFIVPAGNYFYDGMGYIFTPQEIQDKIEEYTPMVDPDPQMNVYPVAGEKVVIQYTDDWGDTNFKMLVDLPL